MPDRAVIWLWLQPVSATVESNFEVSRGLALALASVEVWDRSQLAQPIDPASRFGHTRYDGAIEP